MAKEIEVLENIKKQEESSERKVKEAEAQAAKTVEAARMEAQKIIETANMDAAKYTEDLMQKTENEAEIKRQEVLAESMKSVLKVKPADKASILRIFQKAINERFGV
jgi:ATP synthase H subunit